VPAQKAQGPHSNHSTAKKKKKKKVDSKNNIERVAQS
jgi:hypothetical protein